jgi:hypothetical protein
MALGRGDVLLTYMPLANRVRGRLVNGDAPAAGFGLAARRVSNLDCPTADTPTAQSCDGKEGVTSSSLVPGL